MKGKVERMMWVVALLCLSMASLVSALIFSAAYSDITFRGWDAVQAPDAIFAMWVFGATCLASLIALPFVWRMGRGNT